MNKQKIYYLFLLVFSLILSSCFKPTPENSYGEATLNDGEVLNFKGYFSKYEDSDEVIINLNFPIQGAPQYLFSFAKIPSKEASFKLSKRDYSLTETQIYSRFYTQPFQEDVNTETYDVYEDAELENYIEITKIGLGKIEGKFQCTYVISDEDYGKEKFFDHLPDTLVLTNGSFTLRSY